MPQLIAGLYEIQQQIGSGGGGIVYLGRHTRLNKTVVLKADKRQLSVGTDTLRREVDMLKNLSHAYIPQVYDFVQEDGVVYTVMDFIDGESLDKMLNRGEIPPQPQVIEWAYQLLEALCYLHGQPPYGILHADIKPANIMLRSNGKICLIDYNIALALGEEGAVKVGFSRGYASPEHYGADYISANRAAAVGLFKDRSERNSKTDNEETEVFDSVFSMEDESTEVDQNSIRTMQESSGVLSGGSSKTSSKKGILLDVRSDIYSLGATLYHLISGQKPAQDAREVMPLGVEVCSPAVAAILQKAMAPMPEDRYQTAEEMLTAFHELYTKDVRVLKYKTRMVYSVIALTTFFLMGGMCTFTGLKQMQNRQEALTLAEYSANALAQGDVSRAVSMALQAIPMGSSIFNAPVTAQAQKALTDALAVYDLSDGFKALDTVALPSAPFCLAKSPDGTRIAIVYAYETVVYDLNKEKQIAVLVTQQSALADVVFLDEDRIIYAGEQGVTAYDLATQSVLWVGETATMLSLSGDGTKVAAVNRDADHAVIYDAVTGSKVTECYFEGKKMNVPANDIFADAADYIFTLNDNGNMLAVSFADGGLTIFNLINLDNSLIIYEKSDYVCFEGGFYGKYFALAANKSDRSVFGLVDVAEASFIGEFESTDNFLLQADTKGIYLANTNLLVSFDPNTMEQTELAYTGNANINEFSVGEKYVLVSTDDNSFAFYDKGANCALKETFGETCDFALLLKEYAVLANRNKPLFRLLKMENHKDTQLLSYDARYVHDEARVSQDLQRVILFNYERFRIYDLTGNVLAEVDFPNAEHVYDQQFKKNEEDSYLEVIWYDGTVRCYSAEDGRILSESKGEIPDKSLTEEFITDQYRIVSALHQTPIVYDLNSGKQRATLEEDDYLTYVTQIEGYILTEYINTEGLRYGLLLDERFQTIAYLPHLCDVSGHKLVFDYGSGDLRCCPIYSLQELLEQAFLR